MTTQTCPHPPSHCMTLGPFNHDGDRIFVDWCKVCGAICLNRRDAAGDSVWTMPVPQTGAQLRAFMLRGLSSVFNGFARLLNTKANE